MSTDLESRIRGHFQGSYAESERITQEEVERRSETLSSEAANARSRNRNRGVLVFAAAFAVTALLVGVIPLLVGSEEGESDLAATTPTLATGGAGRTVEVVVSGLSVEDGGHLAGVLYEGELADLDGEAVGGFWSVITDDEVVTEVVRQPGELGEGTFPFVTSEAAITENGTYTLVLWIDTWLTPVSRWVPINSDGMGLKGCHVVFDVADAEQTRVEVSPTFHADGWNVDCTTGTAIPGTNTNAVEPDESSWGLWEPEDTSMPSVTGLSAGQTVEVVVSGLSVEDGGHLAGVLYEGELADLDGEAVGGFWSVITDDEVVSQVVRQPGELGEGTFPFVTSEAAITENGTYTLVLWVDTWLTPVSRWVPINSDGMGLKGCHVVFDVADAEQTRVEVSPTLHADGWNVDCTTGTAIPGTNTNAVEP